MYVGTVNTVPRRRRSGRQSTVAWDKFITALLQSCCRAAACDLHCNGLIVRDCTSSRKPLARPPLRRQCRVYSSRIADHPRVKPSTPFMIIMRPSNKTCLRPVRLAVERPVLFDGGRISYLPWVLIALHIRYAETNPPKPLHFGIQPGWTATIKGGPRSALRPLRVSFPGYPVVKRKLPPPVVLP